MAGASGRPPNGRNAPQPPALTEWPSAPEHFSPDEVGWWGQIGRAALVLGTISAADLPVAARAAQMAARVDRAMAKGDDFKPTALNALVRLELDYFKQLGLSPQARRSTNPLPAGEDEEDEMTEFERK